MHLGFKEAQEMMKVLEKRYKLGLNIAKMEKDIKKAENALKPVAKQQELLDKGKENPSETSYIG
jgi:proteasome assembly chaperone (PAC2) family protein